MNCISASQLQAYLEGTLHLLEKKVIEEHLKTCNGCKRELLELKLLLYELDEIKKANPPIPAEIAKVREKVLFELFAGDQDTMNLTEILNLQKKNFANASTFIKFIPGVKKGQSYLKQGLNKAPSAVLALSCSALKGGLRKLQTRFSI
ncbi:hypothetical protein SPACI_038950 [Sporomusa acidovorans DSM 3132]|uniref:Anti-sigma-W factor RsiW n=1 Tax=Sporomusa acidovorans (strain ATCC 49682 / DSM 3132 / Mol) TaxID=1123286 RepID=A0ABZ3J6P9_SPOA4|nr:hypothetical protein SPACI_22000 [Sporomusa acidovorans DSM 3132]SDF17236.1 Putative zinc-finger [Sporomusa acidovorans]